MERVSDNQRVWMRVRTRRTSQQTSINRSGKMAFILIYGMVVWCKKVHVRTHQQRQPHRHTHRREIWERRRKVKNHIDKPANLITFASRVYECILAVFSVLPLKWLPHSKWMELPRAQQQPTSTHTHLQSQRKHTLHCESAVRHKATNPFFISSRTHTNRTFANFISSFYHHH